MRRLYFDYSSTTPLSPLVASVYNNAYRSLWMNPSNSHKEGRLAKQQLEEARVRISVCLGCDAREICFTSGATEANNTVLYSVWELRPPERDTIVSTPVEHDSVLESLVKLSNRGARILFLPVSPRGEVAREDLERLLDSRTLLVSMMTANHETGHCFPIHDVASLCRDRGILVHTDAASAVGKMDLNFKGLKVDFLTFTGHKFHGPKGAGGLICRQGTPFRALMAGGPQEFRMRAGTENVPALVAMAAALQESVDGLSEGQDRLRRLRLKLKSGLEEADPSVLFHESEDHQLPGVLNLSFPGVEGQTMVARLDLEGVALSAGSACQSGAARISHVLKGMGLSDEESSQSIRISFGGMTTEEEVGSLLEIFKKVLPDMKRIAA